MRNITIQSYMTRNSNMSLDHKTCIVAITSGGRELGLKLKDMLNCPLYISQKHLTDGCIAIDKKFDEFVGELFSVYEGIIFIMATGIVVRSIAPYIKDKTVDPAIIVLDEKGRNVISLLSGHIGGANEMTIKISSLLNANPVITTATDVNEKSAFDIITKSVNGYVDDYKARIKEINSLLIEGKKVGLYMDEDFNIDTRGFTLINEANIDEDFEKIVCISSKRVVPKFNGEVIKIIPRNLVLSVGCRKDTGSELMYESFLDFVRENDIEEKAIIEIGSVDVKKDEKAIIDLSNKLKLPFKVVNREEILKIEDRFPKSEFVKKSIGVYSVSEPVAYLLSGGNLIIGKTKYKGITFGLGRVKI